MWNVRATRLIVDAGRVVGVEGRHERTGAAVSLRASSVVIATGGFQSNLALVKAHWPRDIAAPTRILVGAGVHALGTGLELARGAGAVTSGSTTSGTTRGASSIPGTRTRSAG